MGLETVNHRPSISVFLIFTGLWLLVGLYAIWAITPISNSIDDSGIESIFGGFSDDQKDTNNIQLYHPKSIFQQAPIFLVVNSCACLFFAVLYISVLRYVSKFFIYFVLVILWLSLIAHIFSITKFMILSFENPMFILTALFSILQFIISALIVMNVNSIGVDVISHIIEDSSRVISFYRRMLLIGALVFVVVNLAGIFAFYVMKRLISANWTFGVASMMLINLTGFMWIFCFCFNLGYVAISSVVVTWQKSHDKKLLFTSEVTKNLLTATELNLGAIAYGSSIMSLSTECRALLRYNLRSSTALAVLFMITNPKAITDSAFTIGIIEKTDFIASVRKVFDILIVNPIKCFVLYFMCVSSAGLGFLLVIMFMIFSISNSSQWGAMSFLDIYLLFLAPMLMVMYVLISAITSTIVCHLHDNNDPGMLKMNSNLDMS